MFERVLLFLAPMQKVTSRALRKLLSQLLIDDSKDNGLSNVTTSLINNSTENRSFVLYTYTPVSTLNKLIKGNSVKSTIYPDSSITKSSTNQLDSKWELCKSSLLTTWITSHSVVRVSSLESVCLMSVDLLKLSYVI